MEAPDSDPGSWNSIFDCHSSRVVEFRESDPFNGDIVLEGAMCKQEGPYFGYLNITSVASVFIPPFLLYGIPPRIQPYKSGSLDLPLANANEHRRNLDVFIYPGVEVLVFKYAFQDKTLHSIRPRAAAFLCDTNYGKVLSLCKRFLQWDSTKDISQILLKLFPVLEVDTVQSVCCILCGAQLGSILPPWSPVPPFELALVPLWTQHSDGSIEPYLEPGKELEAVDENKIKALAASAEGEGTLLLLFDSDRCLVPARQLYRLVPPALLDLTNADVQERRVAEAIHAIRWSGKKWTVENIRAEFPLSAAEWKKLGPGIMAQMKNVISTDPRTPSALVLVGIPGSGKSTFSKELCKHGPWVHVCQDELKTRKVCKAVIENAIDRGMSVIIDRCNPDPLQRTSWIETVRKQGVWNIIAVYLDINKNECMNRVMSRKNHPTLPATEKAKVIVDEFYDQLQKPTLSEGFREIVTIRTDKEFRAAIQRFSKSSA